MWYKIGIVIWGIIFLILLVFFALVLIGLALIVIALMMPFVVILILLFAVGFYLLLEWNNLSAIHRKKVGLYFYDNVPMEDKNSIKKSLIKEEKPKKIIFLDNLEEIPESISHIILLSRGFVEKKEFFSDGNGESIKISVLSTDGFVEYGNTLRFVSWGKTGEQISISLYYFFQEEQKEKKRKKQKASEKKGSSET